MLRPKDFVNWPTGSSFFPAEKVQKLKMQHRGKYLGKLTFIFIYPVSVSLQCDVIFSQFCLLDIVAYLIWCSQINLSSQANMLVHQPCRCELLVAWDLGGSGWFWIIEGGWVKMQSWLASRRKKKGNKLCQGGSGQDWRSVWKQEKLFRLLNHLKVWH